MRWKRYIVWGASVEGRRAITREEGWTEGLGDVAGVCTKSKGVLIGGKEGGGSEAVGLAPAEGGIEYVDGRTAVLGSGKDGMGAISSQIGEGVAAIGGRAFLG